MTSLSKLLKQIDIYGYQVNLNFNRQGSFHNTVIGGVFSLLTAILIAILGF
jgi:hypothetical protein